MASLSDSNGRRQGVERGSLDDSTWREQDFREMKVGQSAAERGLGGAFAAVDCKNYSYKDRLYTIYGVCV